MICLTGDIHHASLKTNDQRYIRDPQDSEVKISAKFLKLIQKRKLKVTFYVTGKTLLEEWDDLKPIAASGLVEIGGHTYSGIPLGGFHRLLYRIRGRTPPSHGSTYGRRSAQEEDIKRMIDIVKDRARQDIVSWRSHGYVHDNNTYSLLAEQAVKMISDEISRTKVFPQEIEEGLISHPINVIPDHDHIYHAHRNKEFVQKAQERGYGTDDFSSDSYTVEEWGKMVKQQVIDIEMKKGIATVLMHPLCMYLADEFKTAESLLETFSQHKTIWAKEMPLYMDKSTV